MKKIYLFLLLCLSFQAYAETEVIAPEIMISDVPLSYELNGVESTSLVSVDGNKVELLQEGDIVYFEYKVSAGQRNMDIIVDGEVSKLSIHPIPLWMSILPPLIAILLALFIKEVITSLFIGIFIGTLIMAYYGDSSIFLSFLTVVDTYVINSLVDSSHISVIFFSMTIAAVVSIISKNGGMRGVVDRLAPYASNAKRGQLVVWFMGILIFFDDYANTLVVGNTMRPVTDRLKISREKLAYIVDSTAAPVAAIAFITTWIGAELGYIESGVNEISSINESAYSIFLNSLAYSFYPILTLIFIYFIIRQNRDFGPMYRAEIEARNSDDAGAVTEVEAMKEFKAKEGVQPKAYNAIIPVAVIIFGALIGMLYTGYDSEVWQSSDLGFFRKLSLTIGNADSFVALVWSSVSGLAVAIILTMSQGILNLHESIDSALEGYKTMLPTMFILILAWSLAAVTEDMHTASFLKGLWSPSLSPIFIPAVVFILSGLVSFSTGSSWGTMAILYPLMLPASYQIAIEGGMSHPEAMVIFYNVVSVILAGSVFGDHCSPISDTTILSSLASSCNHIDHVKTQLPYALTVGVVSILIGSIPAAMGISPLILFPIAIAILWFWIRFRGKLIA